MTACSISIIIPAFNVEKYLGAALDSIKAQDQLPDEVILIDDGSTDRTLEIAKSYHFPIPYQVVSIQNGGQGNARNLGVSLASSEYIYFFDSDDLLTKNCVSTLKKQINSNQYPDILLFSGDSFNDSEYQGERWVNYRRGFSGTFSRTEFLDKASTHKALFCQPCLYVSRKSLWGPQGLAFEASYLEDEALFFPLLFSCHTFVVFDEVLFLRRNRAGSTMTMVRNEKHLSGALNCVRTTLELYSSKELNDKERRHILRRLESRCIVYILTARKAGLPVSVNEMVKTIVKAKSVSLAVKTLFYGVGADQSGTLSSAVRVLKRVGRVRKLARG